MHDDQPIVIRTSTSLNRLLVIVAGGMLAMSVVAFVRGPPDRVVGVVLFGFVFVRAVLRARRPSPLLELSADGIVQPRWGGKRSLLPWRDVVAVRGRSVLGERYVVVEAVGRRRLWIAESMVATPADDLLRLVVARARAAGARPHVVSGPAASNLGRRLEFALLLVLAVLGALLLLAGLVGSDTAADRLAAGGIGAGIVVTCVVIGRKRLRRRPPSSTTFRL